MLLLVSRSGSSSGLRKAVDEDSHIMLVNPQGLAADP